MTEHAKIFFLSVWTLWNASELLFLATGSGVLIAHNLVGIEKPIVAISSFGGGKVFFFFLKIRLFFPS